MARRRRELADQTLHPTGTAWVSRPRLDERTTREPLDWFNRVKFLLLFTVLFWLFVWTAMSDNPLLSFEEALRQEARAKWVLWLLLGIEAARQLHFVLTEHSSAYHVFWRDRVWAGFDRRVQAIDPWLRYRLSRALKLLLLVAILAVIGAVVWDVPPLDAIAEAPSRIGDYLFNPAEGMPLIVIVLLQGTLMIGQFVLLFWFLSRGGVDTYFPDDIRTRFSDVWGQDPVLARVQENVLFLENPHLVEEKGGNVPGGILLWGPPGTGKTLMAEAVAGETGKPFVFVDPGAFINMFFGVGILKVKSLFRKLRKLALKYGGVIVFFDEADSLGNRGQAVTGLQDALRDVAGHCHGPGYLSRDAVETLARARADGQGAADAADPREPSDKRRRVVVGNLAGGGGGMGTLQALLTEISGLKKPRGILNRYLRRLLGMRPKPPPRYRILIIMATNLPQALDPALLRPGRIDRIYRVGYPTKAGRIKTYEGYLAKVTHALTPEQLDKLATMTPYATGASIKDLVNEALIVAVRDGRQTVTWPDVVMAKNLKSLGPSRDVQLVPQDRHGVAIHEACHALVAYRVYSNVTIDLATIDPGNDYLGMVMPIPIEERFKQPKSQYESDIMVSLASLAGERLFFEGDSASGVSADLEQATTLGILMEGYWGMGKTIASHAATLRFQAGGSRPLPNPGLNASDVLETSLGGRVEANLARLMRHTEELLRRDREHVICLAHALETHKTLSGDDVVAVIERTPGVMLDGRHYADPHFVRRIERYHDDMMAAHKQGLVEVDVPLPVYNEGNGEAELVGAVADLELPAAALPPVAGEVAPE